jgi:aminoglycoside phosphotransferase (APT) family kinase protein
MSKASDAPPAGVFSAEVPLAEVPPGIDLEKVCGFFAAHVPGGDVPLRFSLIAGGRSNLTYTVEGGDQTWVMRRPPLGHVLPTAHDMKREHRVLSALAATDVPAPRPLALCEDESVNGAPFYVMTYTPGVVAQSELPRGYATREAERRAMSLALVDVLVRLHRIDYREVGLADFGRPDGYLERQVRRWSQQWERSKTRECPEIEELIRRLGARVPESPDPTIVHGDFRFGNMALDAADPGRVVAIFDWEMSTLGDPLADLGYTLMYWGEVSDSPERLAASSGPALTAKPGFLTRDELTHEYSLRSGRDASECGYYEALANYKLAVIAEGIHARFLQGKTVGEGFDDVGRGVELLVARGLELLPD